MKCEISVWLCRDGDGVNERTTSLFLKKPEWNHHELFWQERDENCDSFVQFPPGTFPDVAYPPAGQARLAKLVLEVEP